VDRAIRLEGEIDIGNATEIGDMLCEQLHRDAEIVVDLSDVTFIDSSGIAMMVRVDNYAEILRRSTTWRGAREETMRLLTLTGVDRRLRLA
jgi:anti-sigma B factor antagonist